MANRRARDEEQGLTATKIVAIIISTTSEYATISQTSKAMTITRNDFWRATMGISLKLR